MSDNNGHEKLSERAVQSSVGVAIRERYGLVLLLILGGYLLAGFDPSPLIQVVTVVLWMTLLLLTLWAPGVPQTVRSIGLVAIGVIGIMVISLSVFGGDAPGGWGAVLLGIAQIAAIVAIVSRILQHDQVTLQTVMGGIAAYALIAFAMAAIYQGVDLITQQTFLNGAVARGDYTYFSFVTLTTVGYGDITAATDLAKRLVVIEAFVGQVFIIVFVARLVSLWGIPRRLQ